MREWHIWSVNQQLLKHIEKHVSRFLSDSVELFYPTQLKAVYSSGKKTKRRSLLYGGYVFFRYDPSSNIPSLLKNINGVRYHIGKCSVDDIEAMQKHEEWNADDRSLGIGDSVQVMCGPLKGHKGVIKDIGTNASTITVSFFNRSVDCAISNDDLEILKK